MSKRSDSTKRAWERRKIEKSYARIIGNFIDFCFEQIKNLKVELSQEQKPESPPAPEEKPKPNIPQIARYD